MRQAVVHGGVGYLQIFPTDQIEANSIPATDAQAFTSLAGLSCPLGC